MELSTLTDIELKNQFNWLKRQRIYFNMLLVEAMFKGRKTENTKLAYESLTDLTSQCEIEAEKRGVDLLK